MNILFPPFTLLIYSVVLILCSTKMGQWPATYTCLAIEAWWLPGSLLVIPLAVLWLVWQCHWLFELCGLHANSYSGEIGLWVPKILVICLCTCVEDPLHGASGCPAKANYSQLFIELFLVHVDDWIFIFEHSLLTLIKNIAKCGRPYF